ncbi:LysE family translocator [Rhizobium sp. BE258]|jgi:threonine/homoserine/homoserine lactone efflux protein|uniref:LysE family translocator n=1 Tax=Rhizobium sp. BE258 TaxID=2817722 RepID=UPI002860CFA5|nr:LysE family translocator [Rhizobium sp. BE258]MDR7143761.1 threonine/homoserine/homoserine lactone efflux protein [Rhizobium sp. BE258]
MSPAAILASIFAAMLIGAMSPGPSFVVVSRIAISRSRLDGLCAALGMGIGGVIFSALALAGLTALLTQFSWLYLVLKIAGGAYLVYIAYRIWQGAAEPLEMTGVTEGHSSLRRSFSTALLTQLSNPKTIVVYASIFAAFLPKSVPLAVAVGLPIGIFAIETGWYTVVALAFSARRPRQAYLAAKAWIDRAAGVVMGGLGLRLIYAGVTLR